MQLPLSERDIGNWSLIINSSNWRITCCWRVCILRKISAFWSILLSGHTRHVNRKSPARYDNPFKFIIGQKSSSAWPCDWICSIVLRQLYCSNPITVSFIYSFRIFKHGRIHKEFEKEKRDKKCNQRPRYSWPTGIHFRTIFRIPWKRQCYPVHRKVDWIGHVTAGRSRESDQRLFSFICHSAKSNLNSMAWEMTRQVATSAFPIHRQRWRLCILFACFLHISDWAATSHSAIIPYHTHFQYFRSTTPSISFTLLS